MSGGASSGAAGSMGGHGAVISGGPQPKKLSDVMRRKKNGEKTK